MKPIAFSMILVALVATPTDAFAQDVNHIPLAKGLRMVSASQSPLGDRENLVTVEDVSPTGVSYAWTVVHRLKGGTVDTNFFERFVRAEDLTSAPRLNDVFSSDDPDRFPGSTAFSISSAVLQRIKSGVSVPFSVATVEGEDFGTGWEGATGGGFLKTRVYVRGTVTRVPASTTSMSLLVNGRRSTVPVVRANGSFTLRDKKIEFDFLVLDDAENPLLLRVVWDGGLLHMIRIDLPGKHSAVGSIEADLASTCRAEISGVYFEFGSADLRAESEEALADIGRVLGAHAEWKLSIEGHTDSIGSAAANLALSQQRAEAVRTALSTRYHVAASRLTAVGFGPTKPREPNASLEGRARNRRVEMVRACAGRP